MHSRPRTRKALLALSQIQIKKKHPLSLRERVRERGYKIEQLLLFDPLSPALPLRGREFLEQP